MPFLFGAALYTRTRKRDVRRFRSSAASRLPHHVPEVCFWYVTLSFLVVHVFFRSRKRRRNAFCFKKKKKRILLIKKHRSASPPGVLTESLLEVALNEAEAQSRRPCRIRRGSRCGWRRPSSPPPGASKATDTGSLTPWAGQRWG